MQAVLDLFHSWGNWRQPEKTWLRLHSECDGAGGGGERKMGGCWIAAVEFLFHLLKPTHSSVSLASLFGCILIVLGPNPFLYQH